MDTLEHFRDGGLGMYPTLVFGLVLLVVAGRYATRPERRYVPLLVALNLLTLSAGALGFVSGVITTSRQLEALEPGRCSSSRSWGSGSR